MQLPLRSRGPSLNQEDSSTPSVPAPHHRDQTAPHTSSLPHQQLAAPSTQLASPTNILHRMHTLLTFGPQSPTDYFLHELALMSSHHPSAQAIEFDVPALWLGFRILTWRGHEAQRPEPQGHERPAFSIHADFFPDMYTLLPMLPIKDGQRVARSTLFDLIIAAAKECNMSWAMEMRGRAGVLFGIVHACVILRYYGTRNTSNDDDELAEMLSKASLGVVGDRDEDGGEMMEELAGSLAVVLDLGE